MFDHLQADHCVGGSAAQWQVHQIRLQCLDLGVGAPHVGDDGIVHVDRDHLGAGGADHVGAVTLAAPGFDHGPGGQALGGDPPVDDLVATEPVVLTTDTGDSTLACERKLSLRCRHWGLPFVRWCRRVVPADVGAFR